MSTTRYAAERIVVGRDEITIHVGGDVSGGVLLAADVRLPAGGGPPFMHRHEPDEVFRLSEGELVFYVEDDSGAVTRSVATADAVVHIPGGRAHTVRNESDAEAVAYVVYAPGGPMERFVRAVGALAEEGPPSMQDVAAAAERHGISPAGPIPRTA